MTKEMGAPRGRNIFADLEKSQDVISDAPASEPPSLQASPAEPTAVVAPENRVRLDLNAIRALKPRKEPTLQTNSRIPISILDDIETLKLFGYTQTEIITEGTRREVARLKKQHGLE